MAWPAVTYRWTDIEGGSWLSQTVAVTWTDGAVIDFTALTGGGTSFAEVEAAVVSAKTTVETGADFWPGNAPVQKASLAVGSGENENVVLTMVGAGSGVIVVRQAEVGHTHTVVPLPSLALGTYATGFTFGSVVSATDAAVLADADLENPAEKASATNQSQLDQADVSATQDTSIQPIGQVGFPTDTDKGITP